MLKSARRAATRLAAICLALSFAATPALADLQAGRDYAPLARPQPTDARDKIEVTEFFWYGCSHCYQLEPVMATWAKNLPKDVALRHVPADFGGWTGGAKLYYALDALGEETRVRKELFDAIHRERLKFNNEDAVADWLAKKGVDRQKFVEAYRSFAVQSKVTRAQQLTAAHGLTGVPSVVVGGKYLVNASGGLQGMPPLLDQVIAKVRGEQTKPAAEAKPAPAPAAAATTDAKAASKKAVAGKDKATPSRDSAKAKPAAERP